MVAEFECQEKVVQARQRLKSWRYSISNFSGYATRTMAFNLVRITETIPGKDGHVRVARVRIGQKIFERPISRLCPLECETDS